MSEATADLLLHNGAITTLDPARPHARALAASGGTILAVGSDADVLKHRGPKT